MTATAAQSKLRMMDSQLTATLPMAAASHSDNEKCDNRILALLESYRIKTQHSI